MKITRGYKIRVENLKGELLFKATDSDIYFEEIRTAPLFGKIIILRKGVVFDEGYVDQYGTHGSFDYFAGLNKIFSAKEPSEERTHLNPELFLEDDEIILGEETSKFLVTTRKWGYDSQLFSRKFKREHSKLDPIKFSLALSKAWGKYVLGNGKVPLGVKYPKVKILRDRHKKRHGWDKRKRRYR